MPDIFGRTRNTTWNALTDANVRIVSNGDATATKVYVNDVEVMFVTDVLIKVDPNAVDLWTATFTVLNPKLEINTRREDNQLPTETKEVDSNGNT